MKVLLEAMCRVRRSAKLLGALIGAIVQDSERDQDYHEASTGGYPYGRPMGEPGVVRSPYYPHYLVDVRNVPPGALVIDPSSGQPFVRP